MWTQAKPREEVWTIIRWNSLAGLLDVEQFYEWIFAFVIVSFMCWLLLLVSLLFLPVFFSTVRHHWYNLNVICPWVERVFKVYTATGYGNINVLCAKIKKRKTSSHKTQRKARIQSAHTHTIPFNEQQKPHCRKIQWKQMFKEPEHNMFDMLPT